MAEKSKKPAIRFAGFTEAWEQRKAKKIFISVSDKGYPELPVLSATQDRGMICRDENSINIYHDKKNEEGYKRVLPGQFVIHLRSFQGGFAHSKIEGITSPAYTVFDFMEQEIHDSEYWKYVFKSKEFIRRLEKVTYGIRDGRSISFDEFLSLCFTYPSKREQSKIALYLDNLDNLITLHQRKYDKLVNVKKAMLEKMFPKDGADVPEIRFKGFTEAWEQRKLGEVVGIYDGLHQTPKYQDSGIMFLSVENIVTLQSSKYISEDDFKRDYKVYPQENDILMTRIGDVGTTNVVADNGLKAYYVSLALLKYKSTNPHFLSNAIQSDYVKKGLANRTLKTAIPMKINKDEIGKVDVMLPISDKEQKQIGTYFHNLDNLITLHQRKLEKLKNLKKACLEKMFV
ncbi:restriction endonuclease subunit S [Mogibacterium diversum]